GTSVGVSSGTVGRIIAHTPYALSVPHETILAGAPASGRASRRTSDLYQVALISYPPLPAGERGHEERGEAISPHPRPLAPQGRGETETDPRNWELLAGGQFVPGRWRFVPAPTPSTPRRFLFFSPDTTINRSSSDRFLCPVFRQIEIVGQLA